MKRILPIILAAIVCFMAPVVLASPSLEIELTPEPQFNQVWAYETYLVNLTLQGLNLSQIDLSGYTGTPAQLLYEGIVTWRGKGGYDFGSATTGYNYKLDELPISFSSSLDDSGLFNMSLDKDAFEYGMKPFEEVDVTISISAYLRMSDGTKGPFIASVSQTWSMVDEFKVSYLEGKYSEMSGEIASATGALKLTSLNRDIYLGILEDMNASLAQGNYIEAQDIWMDYDEDERTNLIVSLVQASDVQSDELDRFAGLENELAAAQSDIESLQDQYENLEATYFALSTTYHKVNAELDAAKRNLSTAITAIFLSSILFYFLGQRGIVKREP